MKREFTNSILFRLLSPLFSGSIVYLLILLINNNVEQLYQQFLGEELYLCIGLSLLIQELSRLLLMVFKKRLSTLSFFVRILIQLFTSLILCALMVTAVINLYFKHVLGFSPNGEEIWLFNSIFCAITFIYLLLHISHEYLHKQNTEKLQDEMLQKQLVEEEFLQFKEGINPDLLFDSFEAIIVLMRENEKDIDELIDCIAATYRYTLSSKERQLVPVEEELAVLKHLIQLMNYLPHRKIDVQEDIDSSFLIVPGCLLKIVERIVRSSIRSSAIPLKLVLKETNENINIEYQHHDVIRETFNANKIVDIQRVYQIYSESEVIIQEDEYSRKISLPKLIVKA